MGKIASYVAESTLVAVVLFWIIQNTDSFNKITTAASKGYVQSVRTLWGGGNPNG